MRKFTIDEMLLAYELEQMLYDFIEELDLGGSKNVGRFYAEDGAFVTPGGSFVGPAAIQAFYDKRNENVVKFQKGGQRTGRHTFLNVRRPSRDTRTTDRNTAPASTGCRSSLPACP